MSQERYRVGELVYCSDTFGRGRYGYGIIKSITDKNGGKSYYEKDIICGCGDLNTRVDIEVDIIAKNLNDFDSCAFRDLSTKIIFLDKVINSKFDPHAIIKLRYEDFEKQYHIKMKNMDDNLELFKKYSLSRDEKLELVLGG